MAIAQELEVLRRTPAAIDRELARVEEGARDRLEAVRNTFKGEQQAACRLVEALFPSGLTFTPIRGESGPQYLTQGNALVGPGILSEPADNNVTLSSVPSGTLTLVNRESESSTSERLVA